ncbi:hypothetical protein [Alloyangia pacifica]|nr:hypothetical protein [Alloyangia pacifica]
MTNPRPPGARRRRRPQIPRPRLTRAAALLAAFVLSVPFAAIAVVEALR